MDFNELVSQKHRDRLNSQPNQVILEEEIDEDGIIIQPYRYVVGLGERHFKEFEHEIDKITEKYPWTRKKHLRFVLNELVSNTQFSMLREVIRKVPNNEKAPAYFFITIHVNNKFLSAGIEEFGDFFDYYGYIEDPSKWEDYSSLKIKDENSQYYDKVSEEHYTDINELLSDNFKLILAYDGELKIPDSSNRIGLNVIETITDNDFYVTSFYKDGKYMWKRIAFRFENNLSE